jgi:hypothetical protein
MPHAKENPAALADADRASNLICLPAIVSEHKPQAWMFQERRAAWIARRFALSDSLAKAIGSLAFEESRS